MRSTKSLYRYAIVASLAGFLFGFDTVVISGAEQTIQDLWGLSAETHGLAISIALWGTLVGALIGNIPSDRYGRKITLNAIGVLYLVSAIGSALATDEYAFMIFRFIGGLGIGISTIAAPLYISEISPPDKRGRLTGMFQFNIVLGILVAYLSNAFIIHLGDTAWRWMLGVEALPAFAYLLFSFFIPKSPRWLIVHQNDSEGARNVLLSTHDLGTEDLNAMVERIEASAHSNEPGSFFRKSLKRPISLAILIAVFNQLSGINAILYFAPRIFEMTGLGEHSALLQSIGIGIVNLTFTMIGLWLIDRAGRKKLLYVGSFGYILSLGLCAWAFHNEAFTIVPYCIFAFIASHAIGQGAVIWVFIGEIFPNRDRASGQTLGSFTHWLLAALLTLFFPIMVEAWSAFLLFALFCGAMVLQLFWVHFWMPETKGTTLDNDI